MVYKKKKKKKVGKNLFKLHSCFNEKKTIIIFLNIDHF